MNKIKVAVVGVGYLGRQHVRIYSQLNTVELVGVVDKNPTIAESVAREFHTVSCLNYEEILGKASVISLAVPTNEHSRIGCHLISQGADVLGGMPIASSMSEATALI